MGHRGGEVLNIVRHAAHDVAVGMGIQIAHRQIHQLGEEFLPHVLHHPLAEPRADDALQKLAQTVQQIHAKHQEHNAQQIARPHPCDRVDGPALQAGRVHAAKGPENDDGQHTDDHGPFPGKIGKNALQGGAEMLRVLYLGKAVRTIHTGHIPAGQLLIFGFIHGDRPPLPSEIDKWPGRSGRKREVLRGARRR